MSLGGLAAASLLLFVLMMCICECDATVLRIGVLHRPAGGRSVELSWLSNAVTETNTPNSTMELINLNYTSKSGLVEGVTQLLEVEQVHGLVAGNLADDLGTVMALATAFSKPVVSFGSIASATAGPCVYTSLHSGSSVPHQKRKPAHCPPYLALPGPT
jgi:hypothetical protein